MATGTVILTGANSSLGIRTAEFILKNHPRVTAVFTVRDGGDGDVNTRELRDIVKSYPDTKANIHALDLADLSKVHAFTDEITAAISEGRLPALTAVICNAFYWNLLKGPELTVDGFDKTIQIGHIAHVALVLRLVGQFESHTGRVVLLSSSTHFAAPSPLETYPKEIPQDLTDLINPPNPTFNDEQGRGFQRYGNTKLVITTWMHAFNHHLQAVSIHTHMHTQLI